MSLEIRHAGWGRIVFVLGTVSFAVMEALLKLLGDTFAPSQILVVRFGLLSIVLGIQWWATPKRARGGWSWWHGLRAGLVLCTSTLFILALEHASLATVTAVFFVAPVFIAVTSARIAGESLGARSLVALGLGLAGTTLCLTPEDGVLSAGGLLAVGAALSYGASVMLTKVLTRTYDTATIVRNEAFGVSVLALCGVGATGGWTSMQLLDVLLLVALTACGYVGSVAFVWAYRRAPLTTLAPLEYLGVGWAAAIGLAAWGEQPSPRAWLGIASIVTAGLLSAHQILRSPPEAACADGDREQGRRESAIEARRDERGAKRW